MTISSKCWLICLLFLMTVAIVASATEKTAGEYAVKTLTDSLSALETASVALGLDLSSALYEEDRLGWSVFSTDEFEIRQLIVSGYLTYVNKTTEWGEVERDTEQVSEEEIEDRAMTLLEKLDLPFDEIHMIDVRRISGQLEDEYGFDIGPITTLGFIVRITRQIDGYPVYGSSAELVYNHLGDLHKINIRWRQIERKPIALRVLIDEDVLWDKGLTEIFPDAVTLESSTVRGVYAYQEANSLEEQSVFGMQYVFTYFYESDSPVMHHSVPATDWTVPADAD